MHVNREGNESMESFLAGALFFAVLYLIMKISSLQEDLKAIKNKLDRIENHMDLPEDPINEDLRTLLKEGKYVQAVKLARETLGLSLLEGKQYVDALKAEDA